MAKDKLQQAEYRLEGQRRMKIRKAKRRKAFKEKYEQKTRYDGNCCEYGNGPYCDWSC